MDRELMSSLRAFSIICGHDDDVVLRYEVRQRKSRIQISAEADRFTVVDVTLELAALLFDERYRRYEEQDLWIVWPVGLLKMMLECIDGIDRNSCECRHTERTIKNKL